ncbi:hypothetical protein BKA70DRAFT_1574875 [Coprinopsis sp. MPI-PUGE-AT-0042]|nr:hypothetical protein BKA70DRAFT_1574875 [Coprinopsis sp. MPI-PUGE-AT-0042]
MLLRFSLSPLLLLAISGQNVSETATGSLEASSLGYIGALDETTSSQGLSILHGGSESEVEKVSRALLEPRQGRTCLAGPGGPICSSTTCCAAGNRCCPGSCCPLATNCASGGRCCPQASQSCGGTTCCVPGSICCPSSPSLCCPAGSTCCASSSAPCCRAGSSCCGKSCCSSSETCDQNTCLNTTLLTSKRVVRFELDEKKNGHLLRNMCNGMRGENTIELTYSGKLSKSAKRRKRSDAGCVRGYCAKLGQPGLNSCDEFPPAMSDEGGGAEPGPGFTRAINCIPGKQNSRQGQRFSTMVRSSKIKAGERFVISIDCDEVLGSIVPRVANSFDAEEGEADLGKRDVVDLSGTSSSGVSRLPRTSFAKDDSHIFPPDNIFLPDSALNETTNTLIVDFGDLGGGSYHVEFTVETGSIEAGGFIVDNLGDEIANVTSTSSLQTGDAETLSFDIEADGELMGVGLILPTRNTATTISWKFVGEDLRPSSSRGTQSPAGTDGASDVVGTGGGSMRGVGWSISILLTLAMLSLTNAV